MNDSSPGADAVCGRFDAQLSHGLRPGVPIDEGIVKSDFVKLVRQQAQGDVQGVKAL